MMKYLWIISEKDSSDLDPSKIVLYLEQKLKKNPNDLEGWLILARKHACF